MKVGLLTLGCDKNTVDSERYLAELIAHGAESTTDLDEAEVIIVNTCGFIDAAKRESIDAIVGAGRYKSDGVCQAVIAVGCLVQRHKDELAEALPEVDLFLGAAEADRLIPELKEAGFHLSDRYLLRVSESKLSIALWCTHIYPHASRRVTDTWPGVRRAWERM